jgi:hypothetical protein
MFLQEIAKFKKTIQRAINQNIEAQVSAKAHRFEEGKKFFCLANPSTSANKSAKK